MEGLISGVGYVYTYVYIYTNYSGKTIYVLPSDEPSILSIKTCYYRSMSRLGYEVRCMGRALHLALAQFSKWPK